MVGAGGHVGYDVRVRAEERHLFLVAGHDILETLGEEMRGNEG
jgi:hypothetical protein